LGTPGDAPHLNLIYKLVQVEHGGKVHEAAKFSHAKVTYPGRKQVFRHSTPAGEFRSDTIGLADEPPYGAEPLLIEVMRGGRRVVPPEPVSAMRERCLASVARLPQRLRQIRRAAAYPVGYSKRLRDLLESVRRRIRRSAIR